MEKHVFAICAYGESVYLEECIKSLINQTNPSKIILATATPNRYILDLCEQYKIPVYINDGEHGITQDWNFAYACAEAEYVTIAHQDDVYLETYAENVKSCLDSAKSPIIFFADYGELRNGERVNKNRLLNVKRIMLSPLKIKLFWNSRFVRRRILSLGSPICCPSVTYVKGNCPEVIFQHGFRSAEDWEAWELLSRREGAFVYCKDLLLYHRIHEESETSKILGDNARNMEDYTMFRKFWPAPIAKILARLYRSSEASNEL